MRRLILLVLFTLPAVTGCQCLEWIGVHKPTYRTVRVCDDTCPFPGVPATVHKMHQVHITWEDGSKSKHLAKLPVMYAVDHPQSWTGKTVSHFKFNDDGGLTQANGEVDHKLPELITAIGDAVPKVAGGANGLSDIALFPEPPDSKIAVDIQIIEMGN